MERRFSKKKGMGKKRKPSMLRKLLRENNNSYYPVTPQSTREVCPPTSTITAPRVTSVRGELSSLTTPIKGEVHIFRWCSTYVQIYKLFHAVIKNSIGGTKLRLQTDRQTDRRTG
ncbi:uncharacterized protein LOC128170374 [Crassostrea angulata]|uniref:uncharacterized protein LOC128170374 n=1 Tax=Magallana angulata TaxID=2784310 RepID=UPI0022B09DA0|nr:uncharacterized protein LOC128170374 [Crassostrea angulata]